METEREIKEQILNRLFETSSHCSFCGKKSCAHTNRTLNKMINRDAVIKAIDLERSNEEKER